MDIVRTRLGMVALSALLGIASVGSAGCGKKGEATSEEEPAPKKAKKKKPVEPVDESGDERPARAGKAGKYARGDVLRHLPKTCSMLRLYVDVRGLQKNEAFAANAETLQDKLAAAMNDDGDDKGRKIMKALKKAGLYPTKDLREFAMCGEAKDDYVMAIGGEFGGADPLDALSKAFEDGGDEAPKSLETDGVKMLELKGKKGKGFLGSVAPGVLVFSTDKDALAGLKDARTRAADWKVEADSLGVFYYREAGRMAFDLGLASKPDGVEVTFVGTFEDETGEKMKAAPKAIEAEFVKMAGKFGKKMAGTPFDAVATDVEATKISVAANVVTVTIDVATDHLAKLIGAVAASTPKELKRALK